MPLSQRHFHVSFQFIQGSRHSTWRGMTALSMPLSKLWSSKAEYISLRDILLWSVGEAELMTFIRSKNFLLYMAFRETLKEGGSSRTCWRYSSLFMGLHLNPGITDVSRNDQMYNA